MTTTTTAATILRTHGWQIQQTGERRLIRSPAGEVLETFEASTLATVAHLIDQRPAITIDEVIALLEHLPDVPEDLAGWHWELGELGQRLTHSEEGYTTTWRAADQESSCIVEARHLQQRDANLVATPDPRPPLIEVFAAQESGAPLLVDLRLIDDNPFQPRLAYDEERIATIAQSIRQHGLLQTPLARLMPDGRYQLAFGHSRLRAYRYLITIVPSDAARFGKMPLIVRPMDDQTMALHAWIENRDRKDLSAYEEAKAIERYTATFGWSQKKAAELLQLTQPTIANKLRLLRLPAAGLALLERGELSERQAAALLPLADLSEQARTQRIHVYTGHEAIITADDLIAKAPAIDSAALRRAVEQIMGALTIPLANQPWKGGTWQIKGVQAARCADCPIRLKSSDRCPDRTCAGLKAAAYARQQASAAAESVGLPATAYRDYNDRDDLSGVEIEPLRAIAQERGCTNLAVVFDAQRNYYPHKVPNHPNCAIVCGHGPGKRCGCKQALARRADPASGEQARARHDKQRIRAELIGPAEGAVALALATNTAAVWRRLLKQIDSGAAGKMPPDADAATIQAALARSLVANETRYYLDFSPDYRKAQSALAGLLGALGATVPWAPEEQTPAPAPGDICAQIGDAPGGGRAALAALEQRFTPIAQEMDGWGDATPSAEATEACYSRLEELAGDLDDLEETGDIDAAAYEDLAMRVADAQNRLDELLVAAAEHQQEASV